MPTVVAASLTAPLRFALRSRKADALEKHRNGIPQLQVCHSSLQRIQSEIVDT